jgi:hypothetical protein
MIDNADAYNMHALNIVGCEQNLKSLIIELFK